MKTLFRCITEPETEKQHKRIRFFWLLMLLLVILAGWGFFLNFGKIPLDFHDWAEVNAPRLAFLKDAVTKGKLPLHMPDTYALRGVTDRYLALPDMILSPQVVLLRWMGVGSFVLFHTWLMIGLGYWGLLRLKKRLDISLLSFTWIALLFFFNGHMISHYAVGHVTWGGTFLLSWFMELVFALLDGERGAVWEAKTAFLLFFIFLQGSFHQFVWCVIFLGFLAVSNWKTFFTILRAGIAAGLLSAVRIIPPALQMGAFDDDFLGGYTLPVQLVNAFAKIIPPAASLDQRRTGAVMGWWEFDIYVSIAGILFLAASVTCWLLMHRRDLGFPGLIVPVAVMIIFSYKNYYEIMRFFRVPLFSGERVSSRFMILPLVFVLTAGTAALQRRILGKEWSFPANMLLTAGLIPAAFFLWKHLKSWSVLEASQAFPLTPVDLSSRTVANHPDQPYTTGLLIGAVITLVSAVLIGLRAAKDRRRNDCA